MTERLSDERLAELRHRRCGCHYTKPHLCDGCAIRALVDEVRERRAAEPSRTLPCGYTMRLWKCPKCGRTFDDAAPQCGPCNETMVPA